VLNGDNPRFPWQPSTTMLDIRLVTTATALKTHGVYRDVPDQSRPGPEPAEEPTTATTPDFPHPQWPAKRPRQLDKLDRR
jgi:hypothetical protein